MKCEHPSLYAALLVGVLVNVLLRSQTAYWCRAGAAAALVCAPVLAAVGALFAVSWRQGATPLLRLLFALLLAGTSVLELLRLWNLTQRLYPGAVTQLALCLLVLLPILYLRRVSAISQTAYVVLCLLCIATAGMLLSVFPRLHITNLQNAALIWPDFADAARDQLYQFNGERGAEAPPDGASCPLEPPPEQRQEQPERKQQRDISGNVHERTQTGRLRRFYHGNHIRERNQLQPWLRQMTNEQLRQRGTGEQSHACKIHQQKQRADNTALSHPTATSVV